MRESNIMEEFNPPLPEIEHNFTGKKTVMTEKGRLIYEFKNGKLVSIEYRFGGE